VIGILVPLEFKYGSFFLFLYFSLCAVITLFKCLYPYLSLYFVFTVAFQSGISRTPA